MRAHLHPERYISPPTPSPPRPPRLSPTATGIAKNGWQNTRAPRAEEKTTARVAQNVNSENIIPSSHRGDWEGLKNETFQLDLSLTLTINCPRTAHHRNARPPTRQPLETAQQRRGLSAKFSLLNLVAY
jgi:hypothetical protein